MFSILIPSWNNLSYLKLCIDSIRRHSTFSHEILVHINDGSDGTLDWVRAQGIRHTWSPGNIGICIALNKLAQQASQDWLLYLNDDMFCTPGWDRALVDTLKKIGNVPAYLSAQLIEPKENKNAYITSANFGTHPDNFDETGLLAFAAKLATADHHGVMSQPTLVSRVLWYSVGGYSIEFGPGMSSDNDFLMKLWLVGCRIFKVVGASRIYHFSQSSTGRIRRNHGGRTFLLKWGVSQKAFLRNYIQKTASPSVEHLPQIPQASLRIRLKRAFYALYGYPMTDLAAWEANLPALFAETKQKY